MTDRIDTEALRARGLTIKPLEWVKNTNTALDCDEHDTFGLFQVAWDVDLALLWGAHDNTAETYPTIDAAKVAAQAQYEARILARITVLDDHAFGAQARLIEAKRMAAGGM